jgi:hypothetical protein
MKLHLKGVWLPSLAKKLVLSASHFFFVSSRFDVSMDENLEEYLNKA